MQLQGTDDGTPHERVRRMSSEELVKAIAATEDAIAAGTAEIEDFESFILCQKELARRTWS